MIITKAEIKKFRGFKDVSFELGEHFTLIAGQNGTQKSTLLAILTQPFTLSRSNPMKGEKPLSGGNYKSQFAEKFRLSSKFDLPKDHEWTLHLKDDSITYESILRGEGAIRFWKKGDRSKNSGYLQIPVIFLSLKRLLPIGEDKKVSSGKPSSLTSNEQQFFVHWYNKILLSNEQPVSLDLLTSDSKDTLGITTASYDWGMNSSGQDNIGKILLAIISFKRLKDKYKSDYSGGILAIDEIDATLYPGSQEELIKALSHFCSKFNIQVIATTHSLSTIQEAIKIIESPARAKQVKIALLKKVNGTIRISQENRYLEIKNHLLVKVGSNPASDKNKIPIYTEDEEARHFLKSILGQKYSKHYKLVNCSLGCENYIELAKSKVPGFSYPESIIVLDGDASENSKLRRLKNFLCLPGTHSPEAELAEFLTNLDDEDNFWSQYKSNYTKQVCFRSFKLEDIQSDRTKAKSWYREQLELGTWGKSAAGVFKLYKGGHTEDCNNFMVNFETLLNKILLK